MIGASNIFKLNGIIIVALYAAISTALLPLKASHAGIAKSVSPSGMPCVKYYKMKVIYRSCALSESDVALLSSAEMTFIKFNLDC